MKRSLLIAMIGILVLLAGSPMYFAKSAAPDKMVLPELTAIDMVQIDLNKESSVLKKDPLIIKVIYGYFADLQMKKLDPKVESDLMKNDNLLWTVTFLSHEKKIAVASLFATGEIMMSDEKAVQTTKKAQMFIGKISKEKMEELNTLLKKQSNPQENSCQGG